MAAQGKEQGVGLGASPHAGLSPMNISQVIIIRKIILIVIRIIVIVTLLDTKTQ